MVLSIHHLSYSMQPSHNQLLPLPMAATVSIIGLFLSGEATISSLTSQSTFVTISSDATVQANFSKGTVYPITSSPSTYNFTTHHYEIQPSNGSDSASLLRKQATIPSWFPVLLLWVKTFIITAPLVLHIMKDLFPELQL